VEEVAKALKKDYPPRESGVSVDNLAETINTIRTKMEDTESRGKPPLRPPSLKAGEVRGELRVIEYTGKRDKGGPRLVLVEDVVTG
jgi:hypothetical protein